MSNRQHDRTWQAWDETVSFPRVEDSIEQQPGLDRLALIKDALDLIVELWPKPGYASVTLESHQWARLRRLLLSVAKMADEDE